MKLQPLHDWVLIRTSEPGEHILYEKYAAREVEGDEEELVLVREEDVLGYTR